MPIGLGKFFGGTFPSVSGPLGSIEPRRAGPGGIGLEDKMILGERNTEGYMKNNLEGKVVVITGASSGLGEAGSRLRHPLAAGGGREPDPVPAYTPGAVSSPLA
jgi:hypothetical protein